MLRRSLDPAFANALANHESIRPHVGNVDLGELDLSELIANERNVLLVWEAGAFFYHWTAPATYEVHTMVLPAGRGRHALAMARASLEMMAREHGAEKVWTRVKTEDRHTRLFTRAAGMRPLNDQIDGYELYEWRP